MHRLNERTGAEVFTGVQVFAEMNRIGTSYKQSAVYKALQRMDGVGGHDVRGPIERAERHGFRLQSGA